MVGYCSKDEGRSHFKTAMKGISRSEVNVALSEYRAMQRAVVSDNRTEMGKKNFWGMLNRFRKEHLRGISVSPVLLTAWYIQDGEGVPSQTWICPSSAFPMDASRAEAFWIAMTCPSLFTRKHAYLLFFSGGPGGRISSSFDLWDQQDLEFADLSVDQAKACSHNRLTLEGEMDKAREKIVRDLAAARGAPSCAVDFPVTRESDDESSSDGSASEPGPSTPQPTALRQRCLGRTSADLSPASEDLGLIVCPKCIAPGCARAGNMGMVACDSCEGDIHRACAVFGGDDDEHGGQYQFEGKRCSRCAKQKKGKTKATPVY